MAATLETVAKKAGVSVSAVSKALRGRSNIGEATKRKIDQVARQLRYRPNASARALASGRTETIGVVIRELNYLSDSYFGTILSGIAKVSDQNDMGLIFGRSLPEKRQEPEFLRMAMEARVDGMIIIDQVIPKKHLSRLADMRFPVVLVDQQIPGLSLPVVRINYQKVARQAASHLIGLGHRRIAVFSGVQGKYKFRAEIEGVKEAFGRGGLGFDETLLVTGEDGFMYAGAYQHVERMLRTAEPPTAFLTFTNGATAAVHHYARLAGLRVPEDISIAGFYSGGPEMTDIRPDFQVPTHEAGVRSCQLVMDLVAGQVSTSEIVLEASFDPRNGCGRSAGL
ncbi:MAG: LacI family DNA-binding transcriptional regulator [Planctomycetota bacterium]|nr:LacI family DNA-binding transcriptional regulator [Planctomycetota bacterium]